MENNFAMLDLFASKDIQIPKDLRVAINRYMKQCIQIEYVDGVGTQLVFRFKNNVGASLVILDDPEKKMSPYEVAVIRFAEDNDAWLTYPENGITDKTGLATNLTPVEVGDLLDKIKRL